MNRDFVWAEEENKNKMHLVAWDKMTVPKKHGGVGIRPTRQANLAMLAKGGWRLIKEKETLWSQIMHAKYGRQRENLDILGNSQGSSFTWKSFSKAVDVLKQGCAWNIKNGKRTKFWLDPWVLQGSLKEVATMHIAEDVEQMTVADYVTADGTWRTDMFEALLPTEICQKILSVAVDTLSSEEDTLFWTASPDGKFSTKSAFNLITPQPQDPDEKLWRTIWRLPVPERVRVFMWQTCTGKIATNSLRFHRKVAASPCCPRCPGSPETILHTLRDCPPATFFWLRQTAGLHQQDFFTLDQGDWLSSNLLRTDTVATGMTWPAFFSTALWLIWKNRCVLCMQGSGAALTPPSLEHSILAKTKMWHNAWLAPPLLPCKGNRPADRVEKEVGWKPPTEGWIMLNTDGASNGNPGPAGAGGVLRDQMGHWVAGFVANLGTATAILSELWGISFGLDIAWKHGGRAIQIQTDSQLALQLIEARHDPIHPYATLLSAIRRKLNRDWLVRLTHTYREGNRVADWLSKHSLVYPYGMHELTSPPPGINSLIRDDMMGITSTRRVVATSSSPLPTSM
ncbi:unnamed protein product [Linum trigynum]|uniref:RNase H type-1 domain-containing protein n=1 Tax=Linum trigynum TaxID=586398 RepID=A0AAV2GRI0_9ROSI